MKIGLLDLLACPICKYWPIKLLIFNWETTDEEFKEALRGLKDIMILKKLTRIKRGKDKFEDCINIEENSIQDDLVRYKLSFRNYIEKVNEFLKNLEYITIFTEGSSKKVHNKAEEIYKEFQSLKDVNDENTIKEFIDKHLIKIYFLNWYFQRAEIEDGIMICDNCLRWYPISESIPQMLPDNLRSEKEEIRFLEKWKDFVPEKILKEGKPFNLSSE